MKGLIHKVYCELYKTNLTVCFHKETFCRRYYPDCGDVGGCVVWRDEDGSINIYLERQGDAIDVSDCAHEAYHAADFIFDRCGIDYNPESGNEHMAYLVGWIVNKIFDCLSDDVKAEGIING